MSHVEYRATRTLLPVAADSRTIAPASPPHAPFMKNALCGSPTNEWRSLINMRKHCWIMPGLLLLLLLFDVFSATTQTLSTSRCHPEQSNNTGTARILVQQGHITRHIERVQSSTDWSSTSRITTLSCQKELTSTSITTTLGFGRSILTGSTHII